MLLLILPLLWSCLYAAKLTTLPNVDDLTNFEKRLTIIEQGVNRRLYTTERVLGQYLTGRNDRNLANLDVGALRAGTLLNYKHQLLIFFLLINIFIFGLLLR